MICVKFSLISKEASHDDQLHETFKLWRELFPQVLPNFTVIHDNLYVNEHLNEKKNYITGNIVANKIHKFGEFIIDHI